jgi:uncharacterized protein YggU (UPF0235/DUF167 family)
MNINVITHPNAKKQIVKKDFDGTYHIYITQRPVDGAANEAIIQALSDYLGVKKNSILLIKGEKLKQKIFQIIQYSKK